MPRTSSLLAACLFLTACAVFAACDTTGVTESDDSLLGQLMADEAFETLTEIIQTQSDVRATLSGSGPYTLFAPTDDAFTYLGSTTREALLDARNGALLNRVIRYHIVPGRITLDQLTDGTRLTTLEGTELEIKREGEIVLVDDVRITTDELVEAENGLIYPISDVLRSNLDVGSRLMLLPLIDDFLDLAADTGTLDALDPDEAFTVLAPIDDAINDLGTATLALLTERTTNADVLQRVMDFHVIPGRYDLLTLESGTQLTTLDGVAVTFTRENGQLFIDGRPLISQPVETSNGIIFLLRSVLFDGLTLEQRLRVSPTLTAFDTHVRRYPDLVARFQDPDDYTVFGYTNTAYDLIPETIRTALADSENEALFRRVVRYHIVPGRYASEDLVDGQLLTTLDGLTLKVQRVGAELFIGLRKVQEADIPTENGLLYRIESVAMPPSDLFDTALLSGFTIHAEVLRQVGLEAFVRHTQDLSMFALSDSVYNDDPSLRNRGDLRNIVEFHMAEEALNPLYHNQTFVPVYGPRRTVAQGPGIIGFVLDGVTEVGYFGPSLTGQLFLADGVSFPKSPN